MQSTTDEAILTKPNLELKEESKFNDDKKENNIINEKDFNNLQKLLTFVEMPSFLKSSSKSHILLPNIVHKSFLVNQNLNVINLESKKSFFMPNENYLTRSKSRLNYDDLRNIVQAGVKIDKNLGFMPINPELAAGLRQLTYGSLKQSFSLEWQKSYFSFKDIIGKLGYSLYTDKNSTRSLITCIQAYIIKSLLFSTELSNDSRSKHLKLSESKRLTGLIKALADILWMIGEEKKSYICLSSNTVYVESSPYYNCDGLTETIQIFKFKSYELLKNFLRKNIHFFTSRQYCGSILFLYSIAFSRGLQELFEDFEFDPNRSLLSYTESLTQSGINLILTGYATEYLHNGVQISDVSDSGKSKPQFGIKKRSDIGFLKYDTPVESENNYFTNKFSRRMSDSQKTSSGDMEQLYVVGSMLKTPKYPIWVISSNGNYGVLFSLRDDLLTHWRVENNFQLHYLNCLQSQQELCVLSICTRRGRTAKFKSSMMLKEETKKTPLLNHVINTKWFGCRVEWNSVTHFI